MCVSVSAFNRGFTKEDWVPLQTDKQKDKWRMALCFDLQKKNALNKKIKIQWHCCLQHYHQDSFLKNKLFIKINKQTNKATVQRDR